MRYIERTINCKRLKFLELRVYDDNDIYELSKYYTENAISVDFENLKYLHNFDNILYLHITTGMIENDDWNYVYDLKELKALILDYEETDSFSEYSVDCSRLKCVEYIFSRSSLNFINVNMALNLKTLIVGNWYQNDLIALMSSNIDTLIILKGKCKTLHGIEYLPLLKVLSLSNMQFDSVENLLNLDQLRFLELEACNKIRNIELLKYTKSLEYIVIVSNIKVKDLNFIDNMKMLKRAILDIRIESGDLNPLRHLERVVLLTERKNFNLRNKDMPHSDKRYVINSIPEWRDYLMCRDL